MLMENLSEQLHSYIHIRGTLQFQNNKLCILCDSEYHSQQHNAHEATKLVQISKSS